MRKIWRSVLGNDEVDVEDGFFESGGDSILAVTVAARVRDSFGCDFDVTKLFEHATVESHQQVYLVASPKAVPEWRATAPGPAAADELRAAQRRVVSYPDYYRSSVAIVGISCHFPGAADHREFWENLDLRQGEHRVLVAGAAAAARRAQRGYRHPQIRAGALHDCRQGFVRSGVLQDLAARTPR